MKTLIILFAASTLLVAGNDSYLSFRNTNNLEATFDLFKFVPGSQGMGEWSKSKTYFKGKGNSTYFKIDKGFYTARIIYNHKQYTIKDNIESGKFYTVTFSPEKGIAIEYDIRKEGK